MEKETNKFLEELDIKDAPKDVFSEMFPKDGGTPTETSEEEKKPEDDEMKLRNRREKRLSEKLQAERESSIRLAERLATLTEAKQFKEDAGDDYLKSLDKIYGTDTPEAKTATELLKSSLRGVEDRATERALERFRAEQQEASQAVVKEEATLDSMIEDIEDENGVILSDAQKRGFFTLLERMSPKDDEGNVINYADPEAVWDVYQSKTQRTDTRAKDLSARSMVSSGASKETSLPKDALERQLREEGII